MNLIERRGFSPDALIARKASITSAALQPLSSAPVPSSQESRCAPRTTYSSGFSLPRISATTFHVLMAPTNFVRDRKIGPHRVADASRRAMRSASSRATITIGRQSISPATELVCRYRMSCSRVARNAIALAFPFTASAMTAGACSYSQKDRPRSPAPLCAQARFFPQRLPPWQIPRPNPRQHQRSARASPPAAPEPTPPTPRRPEMSSREYRDAVISVAPFGPGLLDRRILRCARCRRPRL